MSERDIVIVCNDMEASVAVEKLTMAFMSIQKWCECNKIVVNKRKTRHMLVGVKKRVESEERMGIDGIVLVENFAYLGVNIDNKLNFEKFVNGTISRVNGRLITLARIQKFLDVRTCLLI